ncbi:MAG: hypothetical protein Q7U53_11830 [Anaerolineaceae bacterium]|jgi:hypothetical protein|nr:hypothetical protein [Anaerolineaceae bacterium]
MTDQENPIDMIPSDQQQMIKGQIENSGKVDMEELAKKIFKLLKTDLRQENERLPRK